MENTYLSKNLRYLRRQNNRQTQEELAEVLGLTRSVISAYEDARAEPNIATLIKMSEYFIVSIEGLTNLDLSKADAERQQQQRELERYASSKGLRINMVKAEIPRNEKSVYLIPQKAAAGYTAGFADTPQSLEDMPAYRLPFLTKGKEYRLFEITGDSMLPLQEGSLIVAEKLEKLQTVKDGDICVVVGKNEGIVLKRVFNEIKKNGTLLLKSENPAYAPYHIGIEEVQELWKFTAYISDMFPEEYDSSRDLKAAFERVEHDIQDMRRQAEERNRLRFTN
ncbi:MAG: helix-turn-helix domain-containing protein [Bacteroidetes bacterium]|nr:MAG: helix-turn-helix domain-containing protein [Bacteroidota bacterium]